MPSLQNIRPSGFRLTVGSPTLRKNWNHHSDSEIFLQHASKISTSAAVIDLISFHMSEMKEQVAAKTSIKNIKKVNTITKFKALFLSFDVFFGGECMMI